MFKNPKATNKTAHVGIQFLGLRIQGFEMLWGFRGYAGISPYRILPKIENARSYKLSSVSRPLNKLSLILNNAICAVVKATTAAAAGVVVVVAAVLVVVVPANTPERKSFQTLIHPSKTRNVLAWPNYSSQDNRCIDNQILAARPACLVY